MKSILQTMARVDKHHFVSDKAFADGMECMYLCIKSIFECTTSQRKEIFGETDVANIIDKYDFITLHETVRREL